jgi:hypothetical protein
MNTGTLYLPKQPLADARCRSHCAVRRPRPINPDGADAPQGRGYNICQTTSRILRPLILAIAFSAVGPSLAIADIVNINPIKDNTLYSSIPQRATRVMPLAITSSPARQLWANFAEACLPSTSLEIFRQAQRF